MKKLPYTKLEKALSLLSLLVIAVGYVLLGTRKTSPETSLFILLLLTFLYFILLLFEYYPQTTNIVTSKRYNSSSSSEQQKMEHQVRLLVSSIRCLLAAGHIMLILK